MKKLIFLILAMSMPLLAQTTLNNNGCTCTSYQGAYLPVTNGGSVAYVHLNPLASPPYFETLDANLTVIQHWNDLTVQHQPSVSQPYLDATFKGGQDFTHQTFTPKYYRGWVLFFGGGTSPLQTQ
jgi:hypothetical protein